MTPLTGLCFLVLARPVSRCCAVFVSSDRVSVFLNAGVSVRLEL